MIVPDLIANAALRFPDRAYTRCGDRVITFAQADRRASAVAAALSSRGAGTGSRWALLARNELQYLELQVAATRAGAALVPLNTRLAASELRALVDHAEPAALFYGPGFEATAADLGVGELVRLGDAGAGLDYEALAAAPGPLPPRPALDAEAMATLFYTSGTTGRPKGVVISNAVLAARVAALALEVRPDATTVFLVPVPLFHIVSQLSAAVAYQGGTILLLPGFDAGEVIATMQREQVTDAVLAPSMVASILAHPAAAEATFPDLRTIHYGASPITETVLRAAVALFGSSFLQSYGMTETGAQCFLRREDHDPDRRPELVDSAGRDATGCESRVVYPADGDVAPGAVGEVICRGPGVMSGYWRQPDLSMVALRGGWMHSGDLGTRDRSGYIRLVGRLHDMIVTGGENVYPSEVERILEAHPAVREAAVYGVPSLRWGEEVRAAVVLEEGGAASPAELLDHLREHVGGYKVPKALEILDLLPRNHVGKVLRDQLRSRQ